MYEAVSIAATGLTNYQRRLDVIANNVANINSAAFKSDRLDFKDALYTARYSPSYPRTPEGNQQKGHGVMIAGITKDYSTGSFERTDRPLDVALQSEGFFELENSNGELVYSRNGSFEIGTGEDGNFLVNGDGYYIHDSTGARIRVPEWTASFQFNIDGSVTFSSKAADDNSAVVDAIDGADGDGAAADDVAADGIDTEDAAAAETIEETLQLGIYTFRNQTGLVSSGMGNYSESIASGEKTPAENIILRQGNLEISNVKLSEEMTRMIRTQRVFQLSSRALQTADDMEGIANNIRR